LWHTIAFAFDEDTPKLPAHLTRTHLAKIRMAQQMTCEVKPWVVDFVLQLLANNVWEVIVAIDQGRCR
jgi:hypothetical protein